MMRWTVGLLLLATLIFALDMGFELGTAYVDNLLP